MVFGVHYYENKIAKLNKDLNTLESDYNEVYRSFVDANNGCEIPQTLLDKNAKLEEDLDLYKAMCESNHNAINQQMDINEGLNENNDHLRDIIKQLDEDNSNLQQLLAQVKAENASIRNGSIQYEYTSWMPANGNWAGQSDSTISLVNITKAYQPEFNMEELDFDQ